MKYIKIGLLILVVAQSRIIWTQGNWAPNQLAYKIGGAAGLLAIGAFAAHTYSPWFKKKISIPIAKKAKSMWEGTSWGDLAFAGFLALPLSTACVYSINNAISVRELEIGFDAQARILQQGQLRIQRLENENGFLMQQVQALRIAP